LRVSPRSRGLKPTLRGRKPPPAPARNPQRMGAKRGKEKTLVGPETADEASRVALTTADARNASASGWPRKLSSNDSLKTSRTRGKREMTRKVAVKRAAKVSLYTGELRGATPRMEGTRRDPPQQDKRQVK